MSDETPPVDAWLHGRPAGTARGYRRDVSRFLATLAGSLDAATVTDVQAYADTLAHLAPATRARALAAVKSFLTFATETSAIPKDIGRLVKIPPGKETLAERILSRAEVRRMFDGETQPRNHALLALLYTTGLRVGEAAGLRWRDCAICEAEGGQETAQLTVFGKGAKTRFVQLHPPIWSELASLSAERPYDALVFGVTARQIERVVKQAAIRVGLVGRISPHYLRHSYATHSIEGGMPIHELQAVLGHAAMTTTARYLHAKPKQSSAKYLDL